MKMAVKLKAVQMDLFEEKTVLVPEQYSNFFQKDEPIKIHPPICQYCEWDEPNPDCLYCKSKVKKP